MSGKIKVLNSDFELLGSTSKAFNIANKEELMREYTLQFSVVNIDSIYSHINENAVFLSEGQYFDICGITGDSGTTNITQVSAEHISYRLSDYTLPNGYAFVGTVAEIAADILHEAKTVDGVSADTVFTIGTVFETGTVSYALDGTNITARAALIGLSDFGVEIEFDNFTVNIPEIRGADNGLVFEYKRNLSGTRRTWQKGNGWSYECNIADLQKVPGHIGDTFGLGDYATVYDSLLGTRIKQRIISYTRCDDPSQNKVTIGVFVRDNADMAIETDRVARETANTALKQGEKYSSVSITHKDGFKATNLSDTLRVMANADDCFVVQAKQSNGTWKTVTSTDEWGLLIQKLSNVEGKDKFYISVGKNAEGEYGLDFISEGKKRFRIGFEENDIIYPILESETGIKIKTENTLKIDGNINVTGDFILDGAISTAGAEIFDVNFYDIFNHRVSLQFRDGLLSYYYRSEKEG